MTSNTTNDKIFINVRKALSIKLKAFLFANKYSKLNLYKLLFDNYNIKLYWKKIIKIV